MTLVKYAIDAAMMWSIKGYIRRRQETIVEYIATHPIFDLCTGLYWIRGSNRSLSWWDQRHSQD